MAVSTYYFDASQGGPTDAQAVWTNDANAFDGSTATTANSSMRSFTPRDQALEATGTTAPTTGYGIRQVRARTYQVPVGGNCKNLTEIYTNGFGTLLGSLDALFQSGNWTNYFTLTAPGGGWTWSAVNGLAVSMTYTSSGIMGIARVEIEVTSDDFTSVAWLTA